MVSLETLALANNPQDAGPASPPKWHRKFTISYASAAQAGLVKNSKEKQSEPPIQEKNKVTVSPDTAHTQDSENSALTVSKIDAELQEIKNRLEN
jgi:hypothetical protein